MGVIGWIAKQKDAHRRYVQSSNKVEISKQRSKQYELEKEKTMLENLATEREKTNKLKQEIQDIKRTEVKPTAGYSKLKNVGKGIKKALANSRERGKSRPLFGVPGGNSTNSNALTGGARGLPISTTGFNTGGKGLEIGVKATPKEKTIPKKKIIIEL